ncbi:MAG TPA: peptidylprolyl isomerase [Stellaceae bacterium]|nr:peptidylprolyl isomerase [Stellaceae bacterium]
MEHAVRAAAVALCVAAAPSARAAGETIANLGSQAISASEVEQYLPPLSPEQREQAAKDPNASLQLVRSAIGRKLLLDAALKASWQKKPEIAAEIERARDEILITSYLQSVALPSPSYPSDAELRQAYDANRDKLAIPTEYHVAQIYIAEPTGKKEQAAADRKAHELWRKARAKDADFAALARANSEDVASAGRGGDLGWLPENQLLPEVATAVKALNGTGITEPVRAAGGWHIIDVMGTAPPVHPTLEQIRGRLVVLMRENRENEYVMKLLNAKHLTVNETAAAALFAAPK